MNSPDNDTEITEVSPPEAMRILSGDGNTVLLDVRTKTEFDYVGHPPQAINIPWQEAPGQSVNPRFVEMVKSRLEQEKPQGPVEDLTILTLCRSGGRSRNAAKKLIENGFSTVINIAEGFEGDLDEHRHRGNLNGWRFHKLPWEQT